MILICFGTRPEWLKIKPLVNIINKSEYKILFTGQHFDLLKDIKVDYKIDMSNSMNRLDSIILNCMTMFPTDKFKGVLVQGDTGSAFACALAAFNRQIPIYYLESGLRSGDLKHPYPEEGYRQMISRIADINFAPTTLSAQNLKNEGVFGKIHVVGNTVLDNLKKFKNGVYNKQILITLHRRENHHIMDKWFQEVENLALKYKDYRFIFPIHPNPNVIKHIDILKNVDVINPMNHTEFINILKDCSLVISDSGGIQEESVFFNKKVIVCRKTTERPEGINTGHLHLCSSPEKLEKLFDNLIKNCYINGECPYGDGNSAQKIKKILNV